MRSLDRIINLFKSSSPKPASVTSDIKTEQPPTLPQETPSQPANSTKQTDDMARRMSYRTNGI